jgi:hypothetical protein
VVVVVVAGEALLDPRHGEQDAEHDARQHHAAGERVGHHEAADTGLERREQAQRALEEADVRPP